ncbi:MAG TPA: thioesterase family protein [Candidatus Acidoferrales bacterium]|nr:thioesterase family protein [Candidatus Acidoferrales bacterium]
MYSTKSNIRVRYADTDQMHGVYNGRYFEYFEVGRADLMRSLGMTYRQFEAAGFFLPLTEAYAKYLRQIQYDDLIEVVTILKEVPAARLRIDYEIFRGQEKMTEGFTVHSFVDVKSGKPVRAPKIFLDLLDEKL